MLEIRSRVITSIIIIFGCMVIGTVSSLIHVSDKYYYGAPIVLMHGVNQDNDSLAHMADSFRAVYPDRYVLNVELGDGKATSIYTSMWEQVRLLHLIVSNDPILAKGFHLVGFSQGTLISRGYIEAYNDPPVFYFVSLSGPQGGQYGTPYIDDGGVIDKQLSKLAYTPFLQNHIAPAQYWRDPKQLDVYLKVSKYLAQLNNENSINETYRTNMNSLVQMIMVYSPNDEIIRPPSSGWFEYYAPNMTIVPWNYTRYYTENLFGLRDLDQSGRLILLQTTLKHKHMREHVVKVFIREVIAPYLK